MIRKTPALLLAGALIVASCSVLFASPPKSPLQAGSSVTLSLKAANVEQIVRQIAEKTGKNLEVSPQMRSEVLIVDVSDFPVQSLLDRIAEVTLGQWVADGETLSLRPDVNKRKLASQQVDTERVQELQKALVNLQKVLQPKPKNPEEGGDEDFGQFFGMGMGGGSTEARKVIATISRGLNANSLAQIKPGDRIVYATTPTRMQLPMPGPNLNQVVGEWVAAHNKAAEEAEKNPREIPGGDEMAQMMELFGSMGMNPFATPKKITGAPAKVLLVVSRPDSGAMMMFGGGGDGLSLELRLYSQDGLVLLSGQSMLGGYDEEDVAGVMREISEEQATRSGEATGQTQPDKPEKETKITYSKETLAMKEAMNMRNSRQLGQKPIPAEIETMFARPDLHEPLSFDVSDGLTSLAKERKLDLVANIPDNYVSFWGSMFGDGTDTVEELEAELSGNDELVVKNEGGVYTIRPRDVEGAARLRVNRADLARLIEAARTKLVPSLDDLAAFAARNPKPSESGIAMTWLNLYAPNLMREGFGGETNWDMIRLWGLLNPTQRQTLRTGNMLSYAAISAEQAAVVRKFMFGADAELKIEDPAKPKSGLRMLNMMFGMMARSTQAGASYRTEPTEIMPNGLPAQGGIRMEATETMYAIQVQTDGRPSPMLGALGAEELAFIKFMLDDPRIAAEASNEMPEFNRLKVGDRTIMDFKFYAANDVLTTHSLTDDRPAAGGPFALNALPAKMQQQVDEKTKLIKESPIAKMMQMGIGMGMGQGQPPKPPTN